MSERLQNLRAQFDEREASSTATAQVAWLSRNAYRKESLVGQRSWAQLMTRLAENVANRDHLAPADAWFRAADALTGSVADPKDLLVGIDLATYARSCGVRYKYPEGYANLFAAFRRIYAEWASEARTPDEEASSFHEFVFDRLDEFRIGLEAGLPNGAPVPPETRVNAEAIVSSTLLLWDIVSFHRVFREQNQLPEPTNEDVQALVLQGGEFLWACYHARLHGIDRDELTLFVSVIATDWFALMDALIEKKILGPGMLSAFAECVADRDDILAQGVALLGQYHDSQTDMTPTDYLNCCLAAVVQDA